MVMRNAEVVDHLQLIGDLMELRGDEAYRVRAYREAARQLDLIVADVAALSAEGRLTEVRGVGPSIARTVKEFLETGTSQPLVQLRKEVPESLVELAGLRHFGPQRIVKVHRALGVTSLDELEAAARDGRLATVPGFGERSTAALLASIQQFRTLRQRIPRYQAEALGRTLEHSLRQMAGLERVEVVGSVRRLADTVANVDLVAATDEPEAALDAFARLSVVREVTERGPAWARARTREQYAATLRLVPPSLWGQGLQQFTGSAAHNEQLRERARAVGLGVQGTFGAADRRPESPAPPPVRGAGTTADRRDGGAVGGRRSAVVHGGLGGGANGVWPGFLLEADGKPLAAADEAAVYARLGLPWVPPELREGRGEVAAALAGGLPRLVEPADVRGDLHVHTTWSDGRHTVEQMARRARDLGREYLAIADHSPSLGVARGLTLERLAQQRREIATVDAALDGIRILSGVEVDIKADGTLDYPDDVLAQFDFVTASIHSGFRQPGEQLTRRVLAALRSRHVDAIGHLTGRVLGRREGLELDVEAILREAAETETAIEINAWPNRLDVDEGHARRAKELGAKLVINTDAHADDQLAYMRYGVELARRAWLAPADVLNTLPLDALMAYLKGRRGKA